MITKKYFRRVFMMADIIQSTIVELMNGIYLQLHFSQYAENYWDELSLLLSEDK